MRATDRVAYATDPTGAYVALSRGLVFCARPTLWGFALWGWPSVADLQPIVELLALELAPGVPPHASLVDLRRLEAGDPRAFDVVTAYLRANFDRFRTQVTRLALVRPPGILGAMVAGFFQVAGEPYPVQVFDELGAAAGWLGAAELAPLVDAAVTAASATSPLLLQLRDWLDAHLEDATLAAAARAMARAPRSLQRDLADSASSFQAELDAARIRLATCLLVDSDSPLTEIAYEIGCASPQHFTTLFKRVTGTTPSAYRTTEMQKRALDRGGR